MFKFRIITTLNGDQVIDHNLKTPYESLSALQMIDYIEVDNSIYAMERRRRKQEIQEKKSFAKILASML